MRIRFAGPRFVAAMVILVAMAAVVSLPTVAFAASATFSLKRPVPSSSSTLAKPKVSVYVVDRYGIRGTTSFVMTIDGRSVRPRITYKRTGDYKRVTLSFQVTTALRPGTHAAYVRVKNIRRQYSSASWKFTILAPPPPPPAPMPVTVAASDCGACHTGYPAAHPMTRCALCHGEGRPAGDPPYGSGDLSAHDLGCSLESPCHGGGGNFPHVLGTDCAGCHNAGFADIPAGHAIVAEPAHLTTSARCTTAGCHLPSLTFEHYRRSVAGVKLSCRTCHASTDARVLGAIEAGSTECESCHSLLATHVVKAASHAFTSTCVSAACHASSVTAIHGALGGPGCDACHGAGTVPSTSCETCHPGSVSAVHVGATVPHTAVSGSCVTALCHGSDAASLHGRVGGPGCAACHGAGRTPSTTCVLCHPGSLATIHPLIGTAHTAPISGCVGTTCHARDVTVLHGAAGGPGCAACHEAGLTPTVLCASCHTGDLTVRHGFAAADHLSTSCTESGCHLMDAARVHASIGCAGCHGPGITATLACATCHPGALGTIHLRFAPAHAAPASTCVQASCHAANALGVHATGPGCVACHASATTPTLACATCHTTGLLALHASANAAHTAGSGTCVQSTCHAANAAAIHGVAGGPGCAACHAPGRTPTLACTICHTGDLTPRHGFAAAAHAAPASSCVTAGCHATSVASVHGLPGGPGCAACHAPGRAASLACAGCHVGDTATLHAGAAAAHAAPTTTCVQTGCHVSDVASLHTKTGGPGCAACHAVGKTSSLTCATCHPGDLTARHAFAGASHAAPASSCVTAGCHGGNAATVHGVGAGPGCAACHAPGATPTLACATCHPGDAAALHASATAAHTATRSTCVQVGCHASDVASLHTKTGGPGCAACHAAGKTASITCAACHPGDLNARHPFAATSHAAGAGPCSSAACHGYDVAALHATGLGCVDCHGPGRTPSRLCATCHAGDLVTIHPMSAPDHAAAPSDCVHAGCHATDAARVHTAIGGPGCAACHAAGRTPTLSCAACHPAGFATHPAPSAAHAAAAPSCTGPSCHVTDAATIHATGLGCVDCHALGKNASLACATCHAGTLVGLHPTAAAPHRAPASMCAQSTCHGSDAALLHAAEGGPGCAACHAAGKTPSVSCAACHVGDVPALHPGAASAHSTSAAGCIRAGCHLSDAAAIHAAAGGPGCGACHASGRTPSLACANCHPSPFSVAHPAPASTHTAAPGSCSTGNCHVTDVAAIHAPGPACSACHGAGRIPSLRCESCHAGDIIALHPGAAASHAGAATCVRAGCHGADVTILHSTGPGCAACHGAGIVASVTCASCHVGTTSVLHADGNVPHTAPAGMCVQTGCHVASAVTLHIFGPGCAPCHAPGVTPTIDCAACHGGDAWSVHVPYVGTAHTAPAGACVTPGCHNTDAALLHSMAGGPRCAACHVAGKTPSLVCESCHAGGFEPTHPVPEAAHTVPSGGPCSGCHSSSAATVHGVAGGPACAACHAVGVTPSLDCVSCHGSNLVGLHPTGSVGHAVNQHPCTSSNCHGANAATTHARSDSGCTVCHATGPAETNACDDCHSYAWASLHAVYAVTSDFHGGRSGTGYSDWGWESLGGILPPYTRGMSLPCATCHVTSGTENLHNFPYAVNGTAVTVDNGRELGNLCIACHSGTLDDWHGGCFDCHGSGMVQPEGPQTMVGSDCSLCHHHGGQGWQHGPGWMTGPTL